ncbi:MAG: N-formylglutamate amidohydrolase [Aestuariivirgaceae bacterium]
MSDETVQITDAGAPAVVVNADGRSPIVLVCEHASNYIPAVLGGLGLSAANRTAHIAWDIGAEPVARRLSQLLDAPLVLQRYSRLVYDCNRPPASPGAMPVTSELTGIPGNKGLTETQRQARIDQIYRPFHAAVAQVIEAKRSAGAPPIVVTVHSFTAVFKGVTRDVELGILHDNDSRLADAMLALTDRMQGCIARRNDPYGPQDGVTHTLNLHGGDNGLLNVMLEVRNDLIADEVGQNEWAERLAGLLTEVLSLIADRAVDQVLAGP